MAVEAPLLQLSGVDKVYGSASNPLRVLRSVDLSVHEGEFVAVVGPSGSGKSTLLNVLGCLDRPTHGTYHIAGEDTSGFDDRRLSRLRNRRIGFVFQSFHLVAHLNVLENVELPLFYARVAHRERHRRCRELIDQVGLGPRASHLPNELSGGERQRAALARALANEPDVILADEPTGNLDSVTSAEITDLFGRLHREGRTILLITHDPAIAATAPRRIVMSDGRIESDSLQEAPGCA